MKKAWLITCAFVFAACVATLSLRNRQTSPITTGGRQRFEIPDWDISIDADLFDRKPAKDYLIAKFGSNNRQEGIIFLDESLTNIQSEVGTEAIARAKTCISFYRSIYRQSSSSDNKPPIAPFKMTDGFDYYPILPSASCQTEAGDTRLEAFDKHVVSGSSLGGVSFEERLSTSIEKL